MALINCLPGNAQVASNSNTYQVAGEALVVRRVGGLLVEIQYPTKFCNFTGKAQLVRVEPFRCLFPGEPRELNVSMH